MALPEDEQNKWLQLIRDAGSVTPPSNFNYLGGDVTDCTIIPDGRAVYVGADWFDGTTVDPDDTYAGDALPIRNGLLIRDVAGEFDSQIYKTGSSGIWIEPAAADNPGGDRHYWPICSMMDPNNTDRLIVGCWLVGPPDTGKPYGDLLDSHILSCSLAFGAAVVEGDTVRFNHTGHRWIDGFLQDGTDPSDFIYTYFEEFIPDYDPGGSAPVYGQGSSLYDLATHHTIKRVGRVTVSNGPSSLANYTYWNGSSWVTGIANAVPMVDTDGATVKGDAGIVKLGASSYLLAAHKLTSPYVDLFTSTVPQGPWVYIGSELVPGQGIEVFGGVVFGQLTKFVHDVTNPAGERLIIISRNLFAAGGTLDPWTDRNISAYAPEVALVSESGSDSLFQLTEGSSNAVSEHSGDLTVSVPLAGTCSAVSEHSGTINISVPLSGVVSAVAEHSTSISISVPLAGASNSVAEQTASIELDMLLSGMSESVADNAANLGVGVALSGTASAIASLAGNLINLGVDPNPLPIGYTDYDYNVARTDPKYEVDNTATSGDLSHTDPSKSFDFSSSYLVSGSTASYSVDYREG